MKHDSIDRLVILDSGLRAERGHHANFTRLLVNEARSRDWATAVYSNREVSQHLQREFTPVAHFSTSPYDLTHADGSLPLVADLANFVEQNDAFEQELGSLPLCSSMRDLILIPTISHNQLLGLARWMRSAAVPANAHIAVMFLFSPGWDVLRTPPELARAMYGYALQELAWIDPARLTLLAETQPVADEFTELAGRTVHVAPWPTAEPHVSSFRDRANQKDTLKIGYLGYAKRERGIHLLPDIARRALAELPQVRFFVQVDTFLPETVQDEVDALLALGDRVEVHRGSIPREQFLDTLSSMDIILMPYDPQAYRRRGSALFSEAAMLGKPMIVPGETWMAEQMHQHSLGGECFSAFDADAICDSLTTAVRDIDTLRKTALAAADPWTRIRTAGAFLDRLSSLAESAVGPAAFTAAAGTS